MICSLISGFKKGISMIDSRELAREIAKVLDEKKAENIVAIETEEVTIVSDVFVIANGTSNTHTKSLADEVEYEIKKRLGQRNPVGLIVWFGSPANATGIRLSSG